MQPFKLIVQIIHTGKNYCNMWTSKNIVALATFLTAGANSLAIKSTYYVDLVARKFAFVVKKSVWRNNIFRCSYIKTILTTTHKF